jgi:hypothetical protein
MADRAGRMARRDAKRKQEDEEAEDYEEGTILEFETGEERAQCIAARDLAFKKRRTGSAAKILTLLNTAHLIVNFGNTAQTRVNQEARAKKARVSLEKAKAENLKTFLRMYADLAEQISRKEAARHAALISLPDDPMEAAALQSLSDDPNKATQLLLECSQKACDVKNQHDEHTEIRIDGHGYCGCGYVQRSKIHFHRTVDCPLVQGGSNCHHVRKTVKVQEGGEVKEVTLFTKRSACKVCSSHKFCEHGNRLANTCLQCGRSAQEPATKRTLNPETGARALEARALLHKPAV